MSLLISLPVAGSRPIWPATKIIPLALIAWLYVEFTAVIPAD
jgi:hypothetical protein